MSTIDNLQRQAEMDAINARIIELLFSRTHFLLTFQDSIL